jgi:two-component system CheB/CheR fusion protein
VKERGQLILVEISDTGIGIEPQALSTVFDAFTQGSEDIARQFGGLGLGLAISKATIAAHGGTLRAKSGGVGKGATFILGLPL